MKTSHHYINAGGYSLVEVLVAVSILMLSIVGPMTIAAKSLQSAQFVRQQDTAFFLAQEGISAVNTIRNNTELLAYTGVATDPWGWVSEAEYAPCFTASGCDIDFRDDTLSDNITNCSSSATACNLLFDVSTTRRAVYQHSSGTLTPYKRTITLTLVNNEEVLVKSQVEWASTLLGGTQSVSLETSLFNLYKYY